MSLYEEWIRCGERLQLTGEDLKNFVDKKEKEHIAREERANKREEEKERRFMEMQHELQMKEQEVELARLKSQSREENSLGKSSRPKLPKFDENHDDMDAYVERFERFAKGQGWGVDTLATSLSSLLTGKGLDVYTSMPPEQASDYIALKVALLKRYQLTEEGFRVKFRTSKPEAGETVFQYVARIRRYFSRWTEMAGTDSTYESLFDLLIREQFIQSCSPELAMFLKERAPATIAEVTRLAEQYVEAHGGRWSTSRSTSNAHHRATNAEHYGERSLQSHRTGAPRKGDGHGGNDRSKSCFLCGKQGHFARDCRQRQDAGHSTRNEKRIGALCTHSEMTEGPIVDNTIEGRLQLKSGDSLPILSGGCTVETMAGTRNLDIQRGYVGFKEVNVLRDTGCELAAVRKELVRKEQFQEKQIVMVTIDGDAKVVPTARIAVDTPYYVGELEVMVPKSLICDLIIGNVQGVSDKPNPDWNGRHSPTSAAAVMTRAQMKRTEQPIKALTVPVTSFRKEVSLEELKAEQGRYISSKIVETVLRWRGEGERKWCSM